MKAGIDFLIVGAPVETPAKTVSWFDEGSPRTDKKSQNSITYPFAMNPIETLGIKGCPSGLDVRLIGGSRKGS